MKYIGNIPELNIVHTIADAYDFISASDPAINTDPTDLYQTWLNSVTGEIFVCIDITVGSNVWIGQLGTSIP